MSMSMNKSPWHDPQEEIPLEPTMPMSMRMTRRSLFMLSEWPGADSHEEILTDSGPMRLNRRSMLLLSDVQKQVLEAQVAMPTPKVGYFRIYSYATGWDLVLLVLGAVCAVGGGAALPLFTVCPFFLFAVILNGPSAWRIVLIGEGVFRKHHVHFP